MQYFQKILFYIEEMDPCYSVSKKWILAIVSLGMCDSRCLGLGFLRMRSMMISCGVWFGKTLDISPIENWFRTSEATDSGMPLKLILFHLDLSTRSRTLAANLATSFSSAVWESIIRLRDLAKFAILDSMSSVRETSVWVSDLNSPIMERKSYYRFSLNVWNSFCMECSMADGGAVNSWESRSTDYALEDEISEGGYVSSFLESVDCEVVGKNSVSLAGLAIGFFLEVPPLTQ